MNDADAAERSVSYFTHGELFYALPSLVNHDRARRSVHLRQGKKFKKPLATVRVGLIGPDLAIARNRPDTPVSAAERRGVLDSLVLA